MTTITQRIANSFSSAPATAELKNLTFKYDKVLRCFEMKTFKPEISKGVLLSTDIDKILGPLDRCPYSHQDDSVGVVLMVCMILIGVGGWIFLYIYGLINFKLGGWIILWIFGFIFGLMFIALCCVLGGIKCFEKTQESKLKLRENWIKKRAEKIKKNDSLFNRLDMSIEVGTFGSWVSIKFGNEFLGTANNYLTERDRSTHNINGFEGLPRLREIGNKNGGNDINIQDGGMNYPNVEENDDMKAKKY